MQQLNDHKTRQNEENTKKNDGALNDETHDLSILQSLMSILLLLNVFFFGCPPSYSFSVSFPIQLFQHFSPFNLELGTMQK